MIILHKSVQMYIVQRGTLKVGQSGWYLCIFYTITSYFTSENFSLTYSDVYDAYAFSQKLKIIIYFFFRRNRAPYLIFCPSIMCWDAYQGSHHM